METPTLEQKPDVNNPPAGENTPPATPQGPSVDELRKQKDELETKLKERDTQIADLNTTKATLEARFNQVNDNANRKPTDTNKEIQERAKRIMQNAAYDPDSAAAELTSLLTETTSKVSQEAIAKSQQQIQAQQFVSTLKNGVKAANPDLDDEIVDVVMNRADELAVKNPGKYKTAQEYVNEATQYVKTKLDSYAQKKNAIPPLPEGARAEGGSNTAPVALQTETIPTAEQEIESRKAGMQKKIL